jgi:hypothetical protein
LREQAEELKAERDIKKKDIQRIEERIQSLECSASTFETQDAVSKQKQNSASQ